MIESIVRGAERLSELKEVPRQRKALVREAAIGLGLSVRSFRDGGTGLAAVAATVHAVADKGLEEGEDDGYYSTEEEDEVEEEVAARGLGKAGHVHIADSIWNHCVPKDLPRTKYKRHMRTEKVQKRGKSARALGAMLEPVRVTTKGIKRRKRGREVRFGFPPAEE